MDCVYTCGASNTAAVSSDSDHTAVSEMDVGTIDTLRRVWSPFCLCSGTVPRRQRTKRPSLSRSSASTAGSGGTRRASIYKRHASADDAAAFLTAEAASAGGLRGLQPSSCGGIADPPAQPPPCKRFCTQSKPTLQRQVGLGTAAGSSPCSLAGRAVAAATSCCAGGCRQGVRCGCDGYVL